MNTYPTLTISLLSQLTDRELQSNYLNHLDRTSEIANLLTQITDKDLALRIVNLALEVDLCLGASLTGSLAKPLCGGRRFANGTRIDPALQQIIVDRIHSLEIPTRLKIELWHKTKSKSALPYLQFYSERSSETISRIQEREGLYNPEFSDRSHPLFEPSYPRLRHFLLGDANIVIE